MSIADKLRTARELIAHGMNHTGTSTHHYKMMSQALAALPDPEEIAMVEDLAESCVPKAAEMARLVREQDKLRAALRDLIGDPKSGIACNAVHHGPNDHHGALDDCPVVLRYMALLGEEAT